MSDKLPAVEKMIEAVQKKKELSRAAAIDYMLAVATGRLAALWRYEKTVPEGKTSKGVLTLAGPRKKRAPKTKKILPLVGETAERAELKPSKPKKRAPKKGAAEGTDAQRAPKKPKRKKSETKHRKAPSEQVEIAEAIAAAE